MKASKQLTPEKSGRDRPDRAESGAFEGKKRRRHPAFGSMKGTFTIAPGVDLTEPAMPEWADLIEEKYGKGRDEQ